MSAEQEEDLRDLILSHLDERLGDDEFAKLQERLESDPKARREFVNLARLDAGLRDDGLGEMPAGEVIAFPHRQAKSSRWKVVLAVAAAIALVAIPGRHFILPESPNSGNGGFAAGDSAGQKTRGVAVIAAEAGAVWEETASQRTLQEGESLEPGLLVLREGLAQIDFFGGASISLSGPAEIELIGPDEAVLHRGRLRADVPPAARGFEIRAGETRLEDLGTSFGLAATDDGEADIIVFDGEVRATGNDGKLLSLFGGDAARLKKGEAIPRAAEGVGDFPDIEDIFSRAGNREASRYAAWKKASLELRNDPRLVAYYDFENLTPTSRRLRNHSATGLGSELDGGIVGAKVAEGRWEQKTALDFRGEGDRVRFRIPGEFEGLTVLAWVRIDALDRHLNSLFVTDYFDPREFHWQLSNQGSLHFATSPTGVENLEEETRRFFSEIFWTPERSGQWFHLATTVDRQKGGSGVTHFINGKAIGFRGGTNREKPIPVLRIGGADLGNWSEPIRPDAPIRTLNGRIDEFAIFREPLSAEEIRTLYEKGKP